MDGALRDYTTLRLGGPAARLVTGPDAGGIAAAVAAADAAGEPVLLVGGGSNLVVADDGFDGLVVLLRSTGVDASRAGDKVRLTAEAGEPWDALVTRTVAAGWAGIECLAGIPGLVGATPVQNVGAYGQEVADTVAAVTAYDRRTGDVTDLTPEQCRFGYRDSVFKSGEPDRYVVLRVAFDLTAQPVSAPVRYAELARTLGVEPGETAELADVAAAVVTLRRRKGMVLDSADHDTWSAGSFFTNPVLTPAELAVFAAEPGSYPSWPDGGGRTKLSAAWLIEHAGFARGYGPGRVTLSGKHTLALTNRGGATTAELLDLAREVRDGVRARFGVGLEPEPRLVGVTL